ncbi:putative gag-polypeptide of LTR copia-type [Rosa chinensis]|uniref:Putative gag-polypeptide of LTR copia-type n=1 Tax=Rosa chinensis TaxID=74649 RepID=A0A2P6P972_ROSCH|nr:putative gag-polypeptide of LTR copia-type [Rosa chinensis]
MASSSSYPETLDALLSSICNLIPIRLESTNYFIWSRRMTIIFNAHGLRGYVDGSIKTPDKFALNAQGEPTAQLTSDFKLWRRYDAGVKVVINATLSSSALPHIIGSDTARDLWLTLERRFTSMSNFNILKYRSDLQTITKGGDSVTVYVGRIDEIRTKLAGFSVMMDDAEMIGHALRGLPEEYEAFRNSITARNEPLLLNEFYVLLLAEEASILAGNQ